MIDVVAAVIENEEGKVLVAKRKPGMKLAGYWEFPGGKVKENEAPEEGLRRELREEMNVEIEVGEYIGENVHRYGDFTIRLLAYRARIAWGKIELTDHDEYRWLEAGELVKIKMAPADVPLVQLLIGSQ
ncbi:MAG: (deoxy)nucleoside triphosphate pyrophosphohydrolase [Firmicutes bacterium]|nr:(deoxy)nucleoside triphosphate pyrophosphohydrolase [Bacillota bacterium]